MTNRNLDIRDAILQLLNVVREGNRKIERQDALTRDVNQQILDKVQAMSGSGSVDKKIDNISTFLLRSVLIMVCHSLPQSRCAQIDCALNMAG